MGGPEYQAQRDAEHIKLLSIFHYVYAGLVAVATLWPLIYVAMGLIMVSLPSTPSSSPPVVVTSAPAASGSPASSAAPATTPAAPAATPAPPVTAPSTPSSTAASAPTPSGSSGAAEQKMFGWFFFAVGVAMSLAFLVVATLNFFAARWLSARRNRLFILILSGVNTMAFPLGTALGVFGFIVLLRPSVEAVFAGESPAIGVDR